MAMRWGGHSGLHLHSFAVPSSLLLRCLAPVTLAACAHSQVALPTDGAEGVMDAWQDGHTRADVTVRIEEGTVADDAALKVPRPEPPLLPHTVPAEGVLAAARTECGSPRRRSSTR